MADDTRLEGAVNQPPQFDLEGTSEAEAAAFQRFRKSYFLQFPVPIRPRALSSKNVGGMFWLYLLSTIAAVILASLRTASQFYLAAAQGGNQILGYIEAGAAVLAIEGGLVVYAADRAVKKHKETNQGIIAIVLMVLISMVAGIGQSLPLIDTISPEVLKWFQYALALLLGAGTSYVAYVGGDVLGHQLVTLMNKHDDQVKHYNEAFTQYNNQLVSAWKVSDERRLVRGDLRREVRSSLSSPSSVNRVNRSEPRELIRPAVQAERVAKFMERVLREENRIAAFSEVQESLHLAKSTASKYRSQWLSAHSVEAAMVARSEQVDTPLGL